MRHCWWRRYIWYTCYKCLFPYTTLAVGKVFDTFSVLWKQGLPLHGREEVQSRIDGNQDSWWPTRFHQDIYHRIILRVLDKSFVIDWVWTLSSMSCISRDKVIHVLRQVSCSSLMNKVCLYYDYDWVYVMIEAFIKHHNCQVISNV